MALTNVSDVAVRLGRPISEQFEVDQVNAWISDVEGLIRSRIRDLDDRIQVGDLLADRVAAIAATAVVRKVRNPEGKQNERIDDYSYGLVESSAKGEIFLTDDEWSELLPAEMGGAFSTRPGFTPDRAWLP